MIPLGILASSYVNSGGLQVTYLGYQNSAANQSEYTFTFDIGTAVADRRIIAVVRGIGTFGIKIGGVTATKHVTLVPAFIASAVVPTGASADVVLTGTSARAGVALYRIDGATAAATASTLDNGEAMTVASAAGDVVIGGSIIISSHSATLCEWTEGMTAPANYLVVENTVKMSAAWGPAQAGESTTIAATWNYGDTPGSMITVFTPTT